MLTLPDAARDCPERRLCWSTVRPPVLVPRLAVAQGYWSDGYRARRVAPAPRENSQSVGPGLWRGRSPEADRGRRAEDSKQGVVVCDGDAPIPARCAR